MARNLDQLNLDLDAKYLESKGNKAWLASFYRRAYAAGKEAGERAAVERMQREAELAVSGSGDT